MFHAMLHTMFHSIARTRLRATAVALLPLLLGGAALASTSVPDSQPDLTLKGNQEGTVFRSLTVEGENRVQIRFERPELGINIDPNQAPGLMLEDGLDILDRTLPDLMTPFMQTSVYTASAYAPRPWLKAYTSGPVARFTPAMESVESWKLQVVDSRGQTAMVFVGQGNPPGDIAWDGMRLDGTPAPPGYTYSYVLEARDQAGNQRRFVGEGFLLPAYRRDEAAGPDLLASGAQWLTSRNQQSGPSALALEAASWINLRSEPTSPVRVIVTHRSVVEAAKLAEMVAGSLRPLVGGDTARVVTELRVEAGAPPAGTLHLTTRPQANPPGKGS
jgi:hypothetical protein